MRFALIVPNTRRRRRRLWSMLPSRGLLSLAAVLRERGHHVAYIDADFEDLSEAGVLRHVSASGADVVGVTMNTFQAARGAALVAAIRRRRRGIVTVVGGPHPSAMAAELLTNSPAIDVVCRGEGERTIVELADALEAGRPIDDVLGVSFRRGGELHHNDDRPPIEDLDALPLPAYDLIGDLHLYPGVAPVRQQPSMHVLASRGCPFQCVYCNKSVWGSRVRFREPTRVVDEIELLHTRHGIREIYFQDDTMNLRRGWFLTLCEELVARGLNTCMVFKAAFRVNQRLLDAALLERAREAGFWCIFYGVESGSQRVLDRIKKATTVEEIRRAFALTHTAGLKTIAAFMVGNLGETEETVAASVALAKELRPFHCGFSIATPLPGTEFYRIAQARGWLGSCDYRDWSTLAAVTRNERLSAAAIERLRDRADRETRTYLSPQPREGLGLRRRLKRMVLRVPVIGPVALEIRDRLIRAEFRSR